MKVFKYKFSKLKKTLIYVGIALCFAGFCINILDTLMFLVPAVLLVILISLIVSSYYSIDGNTLKTSFGIIKSKYDISTIDTILLDRNTNKLTVYFKNNNFVVIVVKEEWYDEFTDALCKANKNIEFSIKSKEPENKNDDDKKKK